MLPLAASAYGSFNNWSGIVWFAWLHGDGHLGADGWAVSEARSAQIGNMITDGMLIDHLRTCGRIFRRGLVAPSAQPITLHVDEPLAPGNYQELTRGKMMVKPGWQDVHAVRKVFGQSPPEQASAPWLTQHPPSPLISDTGQITNDANRKQL